MDSALILLLRLRLLGALRRMGKKLGTARGLLLTLFGLAIFGSMIVSSMFTRMPPEMMAAQISGFRRFGPFFFVLYCLLILLLSPGDKAFAFSPAEVSFLFPGPFGRRSLLAYKIGGNLALVAVGGFFFLWAFRQYWTNPIAGYVGLVLGFAFLQLFQVGVTIAGQAIGAKASTRRRQLALILIGAIVAMLVFSLGAKAIREMDLATLKRLETAPWVTAIKSLFQPFIYTISARRIWPDLFLWGSIALAIDAAVIAAILGLDAQYLEGAATSSERFYAKLERMRSGAPSATSKRKNQVWKSIPDLPWLGGIGPILWRQLTTANRDYARAIAPFGIGALLAGIGIFLVKSSGGHGDGLPMVVGGMIMATGLWISPVLTFDFRGDYERMEGLKTLPLSASKVALGQIAAPWVLLTAGQCFGLAILAIGTWPVSPSFWLYLVFAPMVNLVLLEIDNLSFLLFPSKQVTHTPGDVQFMGRLMVMMMAKMGILAVAGGLAALCGFLAYLVGGITAAMIVAWFVWACASVGFVPLIALAFRRFDVASDTLG
jgi:hypothetical protein